MDRNTICRSLSCGDLDLRSIRDLNKALLAKWLWRFGIERDSLWCHVVVDRFGMSST